MNKKRNKKNKKPVQASVRLSQCMIVKNEEKNIEKALSWAKGIAFEQIVVDTGSTDRTVEIAEKMGARVLHFEWINDFSAAKNYAIEQASGNWIAFLDADEYFSPEDAKELMVILKEIRKAPEFHERIFMLKTPWVQVDDDGNPTTILKQERIFRNIPEIRYEGRIHEQPTIPSYKNIFSTDRLFIIHTGYSKSATEATGKAERNISLLRRELIDRPDDLNLKAYLADSLSSLDGAENWAAAEALYREVVAGSGVSKFLKLEAYKRLIRAGIKTEGQLADAEDLSLMALKEFPDDIDITYLLCTVLNFKGEYSLAWSRLLDCEQRLINAESVGDAPMLMAQPNLLYIQLVMAAQALGDVQNIVKYSIMLLSADKAQIDVLSQCIWALVSDKANDDEILGLLSEIYDLTNPLDMQFIAGAADYCGARDFAKNVMALAEGAESS